MIYCQMMKSRVVLYHDTRGIVLSDYLCSFIRLSVQLYPTICAVFSDYLCSFIRLSQKKSLFNLQQLRNKLYNLY